MTVMQVQEREKPVQVLQPRFEKNMERHSGWRGSTSLRQGGALFGERRYGRVFVNHNGAQSCYGVRGLRAMRRV